MATFHEPLIFEKSSPGAMGVSLPASDVPAVDRARAVPADMLGDDAGPPLPEIGELDVVRHFSRLASVAFGVDSNFYPLGSCTMKYNPKINERAAAMPGFAHLHPLQPDEDVQGLLELLYNLRTDLAEIAGLAEVTLQPAAGAHGEMTGLMMINAYHRDHGGDRANVFAPASAHGTNPATCAICGRNAMTVNSHDNGLLDLDDLRAKVDEQTAALMITNPNTVGIFDGQIADIAEILHAKGALLYLDGANMNAALGIIRPGDVGVDVMHYNTHKTFSTPHGGGGPGAGPVGVAENLRPYLPVPQVERRDDGSFFLDHARPRSIGKVRSFFGQTGVLVRAYTYIRALGAGGLRDAAEKAVLSANYLASQLGEDYELPFPSPCAHEFIMVPRFEGVTELDVAKRLLDFGIHPPTMSWPVHHCLMIEPTETESRATLDRFIKVMKQIAAEARETPDVLKNAPTRTPVRRVDVVYADRKPNTRWRAG